MKTTQGEITDWHQHMEATSDKLALMSCVQHTLRICSACLLNRVCQTMIHASLQATLPFSTSMKSSILARLAEAISSRHPLEPCLTFWTRVNDALYLTLEEELPEVLLSDDISAFLPLRCEASSQADGQALQLMHRIAGQNVHAGGLIEISQCHCNALAGGYGAFGSHRAL